MAGAMANALDEMSDGKRACQVMANAQVMANVLTEARRGKGKRAVVRTWAKTGLFRCARSAAGCALSQRRP